MDKYLAKFETVVNLEHQRQAIATCRRVFEFGEVESLPFVYADVSRAADTDWPSYPYNDTFSDPAKMLLDQLRAPFLHHQLGDCHALNIRCNYGTVILPSLFGLHYQLTENSLPWIHHAPDRKQVAALIARGVPDPKNGLGARCFETADYYREVLSGYPKLGKAVQIYHPDLQGPFDLAHLIWGSDIFFALYDCPAMVHELLALVTQTYASWMREWKLFVGEGSELTSHWGFYIKGGIMLRDDTAVTLSSAHYEQFVKPYDQALLDAFGGCIHFCGRGDAFVRSMSRSRKLHGIHCSQPELNDMGTLIDIARLKQITLLGLPDTYVPAGARTGYVLLRGS